MKRKDKLDRRMSKEDAEDAMTGKVKIYGTLGPACGTEEILKRMFEEGMDGVRLNLSHVTLDEAADDIAVYHRAAAACGKGGVAGKCDGGAELGDSAAVQGAELLIDMQGPELRIGKLYKPTEFVIGEVVEPDSSPFPGEVLEFISGGRRGIDILLDDGKIMLRTELAGGGTDVPGDFGIKLRVIRGGLLESKKSVAVAGLAIDTPPMTEADLENISKAKEYGVTGVMQPFVRGASDLIAVRKALDEAGCGDVKLLGKIENLEGMAALDEIIQCCDEVVIARGDLGNSMDLWELPAAQKRISAACRAAGRDFLVVTQMLDSMNVRQVPTRAEVSDIFNAVLDGASSVMLTGETAAGENPIYSIRYMARTVRAAEEYLRELEK